MAVYVDGERNQFGRMVMCHMIGDTVAELHEMANRIGMKREWFQPYSSPHYDLSLSRRASAVKLGAIEVDRRSLVVVLKRQVPVWAAEYAAARERGEPHP